MRKRGWYLPWWKERGVEPHQRPNAGSLGWKALRPTTRFSFLTPPPHKVRNDMWGGGGDRYLAAPRVRARRSSEQRYLVPLWVHWLPLLVNLGEKKGVESFDLCARKFRRKGDFDESPFADLAGVDYEV